MDPIPIPRRLADNCAGTPERAAWLRRLPSLVHGLARQWSLALDVPYGQGQAAWVAPVTRADGSRAVLKVGLPHWEAEHEIDGLAFWAGDPTVRLLEADRERNAMLLERCEPGTPLRALPEPEQDVVVAGLLHRLWQRPPEPSVLRPLSEMIAYWTQCALADESRWQAPDLTREGLHVMSELVQTNEPHVLLATDLHAGNVLRAERAPWLVIDPKPFAGDPAYDATQHLLNCRERLHDDPIAMVERFSSLLDLDAVRVRQWLYARIAVDWRRDPSVAAIASKLAL